MSIMKIQEGRSFSPASRGNHQYKAVIQLGRLVYFSQNLTYERFRHS